MNISNLTNSPRVTVNSRFVINKQTVKADQYVSGFTSNDLLFVKLTFSGFESAQKIGKVLLGMYCEQVFSDIAAKAVKCNSTDISDSSIKSIAQQMTGDETVIDKIIIRGAGDSIQSTSDERQFVFDITSLAQNATNNSSVMIAISFPSNPNTNLKVYSPKALAAENEICLVSANDATGLNSLYKFDDHEVGQAGKVSINLFSGKPIYSAQLVSTPSKKMPISFSVFQNVDIEDDVAHLKSKMVPNFHFRIYPFNEEYVIEDPSGFKNYYKKISTNYSIQKLKEKYGVKRKINGCELYHSPFDCSYFFISESNGVKTIKLYDQADTLTTFEVDSTSAKIKEVQTSLDYKLTYTWSGARLVSVSNNDGEAMLVEYAEPGYISKVSFPTMNRYINFTQTDTLTNIRVYYEKITDGVTTSETINDIKLIFSSNKLTQVFDNVLGQYLDIGYSSNKVSTAGIYIQNTNTKQYVISYTYSTKWTKTTDLDGNVLYYHFDMYGRVRTIMDKYARTVSYNYEELEDGISKKKTSESKVQTNARNLLENFSFENEDLTSNGSPVWTQNLSMGKIEVVNGGALNEKCLKVEAVSTDTITVKQDIISPIAGSYALSGFIKHPVTTNLNSSNVKVLVGGTYKVDETVTTKVDSQTTETEIVTVTKSYEAIATLDFTKTDWYHFKTSKVVIPSNAKNITMSVKLTISNVETTVYIDDLQLADAKFNTRHNLIENGYMEFTNSAGRPYGWNFQNFETEDKVTTISNTDFYYNTLGNKVMRIAPGESEIDGSTNVYKLKRMYRPINIKGLAGEQLIFSVLGCAEITSNVIFRTFITFTYENKGEKTYEFDFDKNFSNWQILTRDITAEDNYSKVVVGLEYDGGVEAKFDCFQLYKDSYGKYYNYDNCGNLIETVNADGNSSRMIYNSDNKIEEIYSSDGNHFKYTYEDKLLVSARDLYGNVIEFEYDEENRITKQTITSPGETITTSTAYDDVNNTETATDEFNKSSTIALDYLKRVSKHTSPLSQDTEYIYNDKLQLTRIKSKLGSLTHRNDFTYDSKGNAQTIASYGGNTYTFVYDSLNRVTSIKCDNNIYESYDYDPLVNGYSKGNLIKKTVGGSGHFYEFVYNDENEIVEYKLNGVILATYSYDDTGNLYELCDKSNGITYHFEYDLKGNLVKEIATNGNAMSYIYDNLGNLQKTSYKINGLVRSVDYEHDYEAKEYSLEGYFNRIASTFGDDLIVSDRSQYGAEIFSSNYDKVIDDDSKMEVVKFYNYNSNIIYKLDTVNRFSSNYDDWKRKFHYNKTFYAWVKPKPYISNQPFYKTNLLEFNKITETKAGAISEEEVLSYLAISDSGNLIYYSPNSNPTITSVGTININEWNLVGIQFRKPIGDTTTKARIILNGVVTDEVDINENVSDINMLSMADNMDIPQLAAHLHTTLYLAMTSIGAYSYKEDDFRSIYTEGKKYLVNYDVSKITGTHYYDEYTYDGFDVITLNGTLESSRGYKPCKIAEIDKSYRFEKNKIFKYEPISKRLVYASLIETSVLKKGNTSALAYKLPLQKEGTVSLRFNFIPTNTDKCILSAVSGTNEKLGIYITNANSLRIVINGTSQNANLGFTPEVWNKLVIRYKSGKLQAYCNTTVLCNFTDTIDLTDCTIYLGNNATFAKQLNGYLEMFAYSNSFIDDTTKTKLLNSGTIISVRNKMDSLGRLTYNTITVNNTDSVTSYVYDKTRVTSQTLPNGETISYSYNDVGQVVSKTFGTGNNPTNVTYTYDNFGRLIKEVYEDGKVHEYTYDRSGNITYDRTYVDNVKTEELQYRYSNGKLTMIANNTTGAILQETTYGSSNVGFYPDKLVLNGVMKSLTWNGKRLTGIGSDIKYTYNSQGIRIKKQTPTETTDFILEGSNIISMKKVVSGEIVRLDFVYDVNNQIIGLNTAEGHYFYIKDITGNIVGLIDQTGAFVVKYTYDAWGKLLSKEVINTCIATVHNPFIYKGYYYDDETGIFMVGHRYYNPEWGRWLSPDDIEYLDPHSINGLNLYPYCNNDPVNKYDPTGHFAISLSVLLIGGLIAGAIGAGIGFGAAYIPDVVENVKKDGFQWSDLNTFSDNWDHYLGAAAGGFVAGFGVGICTILGAGVGAAALGGTTATLFTSTGLSLSLGSALAIGSGVAFATGMGGYALRTAISSKENFNGYNMLIEGGFNAVSGAFSVLGGALGGYAGVHNTVFTKLLSQKGDFLARILIENMFTAGFKISGAFIKGYCMI